MNIIEVAYNWKEELIKREDTQFIVVHHAEAKTCTVNDIDRWHRERGFSGIGYHLLIRKDGNIYRGRPILTQGAHAKGYNHNSIGVCLEGNFNLEDIPTVQGDALVELLIYLQKLYPGVRTLRHKDLMATECPGSRFQDGLLLLAMNPTPKAPQHWAEESYKYLNDNGIEIKERRFEDKLSRGELLTVIARLHKKLKG